MILKVNVNVVIGALPLKGHFPADNSVPIEVYLLNCTGVEQNWTDCNYSIQSPSESCVTAASVSCQGKTS